MKRTSLTQSQVRVLEDALVQHGNIVAFADLAPLIPVQSPANKRRVVKQLVDAGWLVRIKRGLYQIAALSTLGMLTLSRYTVAQLLVDESYISFETALQYHGMYDQLPAAVTSVGIKQYPDVTLEGIRYQYIKTSEKYYFGWQEIEFDGSLRKVATPEKSPHRSRSVSPDAAGRKPGGREAGALS